MAGAWQMGGDLKQRTAFLFWIVVVVLFCLETRSQYIALTGLELAD